MGPGVGAAVLSCSRLRSIQRRPVTMVQPQVRNGSGTYAMLSVTRSLQRELDLDETSCTRAVTSICSLAASGPRRTRVHPPPAGWTKIEVDEAAGDITVAIHMFNKSTTRIPEAMFVQVLPSAGKYA